MSSNRPLDCDKHSELIHRHEISLTEMRQSFSDFIMRYDNDRKECSERYHRENEQEKEWRDSVSKRFEKLENSLNEISSFMAQLRPSYKWMISFASLVVIGSLGIIWKMVWDHVSTYGK